MQAKRFTGKFDHEGDNVFVGDILVLESAPGITQLINGIPMPFLVDYDLVSKDFILQDIYGQRQPFSSFEWSSVKKIGDIYKNRELFINDDL